MPDIFRGFTGSFSRGVRRHRRCASIKTRAPRSERGLECPDGDEKIRKKGAGAGAGGSGKSSRANETRRAFDVEISRTGGNYVFFLTRSGGGRKS